MCQQSYPTSLHIFHVYTSCMYFRYIIVALHCSPPSKSCWESWNACGTCITCQASCEDYQAWRQRRCSQVTSSLPEAFWEAGPAGARRIVYVHVGGWIGTCCNRVITTMTIYTQSPRWWSRYNNDREHYVLFVALIMTNHYHHYYSNSRYCPLPHVHANCRTRESSITSSKEQ